MMTSRSSNFSKCLLAFLLAASFAACSTEEPQPAAKSATAPATSVPAMEAEMLTAAAKGNNARIQQLLDQGVNVNMRGADRNTPLMEAAYGMHLDTVKLLLDHGADLSAKKNDGAMPIALARTPEIIEMFKNVSALVDAATRGNAAVISQLIAKGTPVNGLDQFGHSALTEASWEGKTEIVKLLLDNGADPQIKKSDGASPLSLATGRQHADIVALLNTAIAKKQSATSSPSHSPSPAK